MSHDQRSTQFDESRTIDPRYPIPDIAEVSIVDVLRAVSDPTRLAIVRELADGVEHPKGSILDRMDCSKATGAYHFRTLREAGLTKTMVSGRTHTLQLRRDELDERFPGLVDALLTD